jgi:hypothetical protein
MKRHFSSGCSNRKPGPQNGVLALHFSVT